MIATDADKVERQLKCIPEADRETPVPLLKAGRVVEKLVPGLNPAGATLHRWALKNKKSPRLEVIRAGNARYTTARMLAEFFVASGKTGGAK
tara:strand:+ start:83743 stop:84018 length:276 start_codon:yes stop_codon:yes gene_type:complete